MKTGILLICVGKYDQFLHPMLNSIDKYWTHDKEIFLFTDKIVDHKGVTQFKIPFQKFPSCSMFRYHYFNQVKDYFDVDYLYYVDVDARFVDYVGDEILGDLVAVHHCGFYKSGGGSWETRPESGCCVEPWHQKTYFGGGFQGGRRNECFAAWEMMESVLDQDIKNDIIPVHHDESVWNWYLSVHRAPLVELSPEYHYTESKEKAKLWGIENIKPKLLLLEKDHASIR